MKYYEQFQHKESKWKKVSTAVVSQSPSRLAVDSYYSVIQLLEYYEKLIDAPHKEKITR